MAQSQPMQILTSHQSQDWYTPPYIIEMVREVLGVIGLDPASDPIPQRWIKADRYLDNPWGLNCAWKASTVFCNPPYGKLAGQSNQAVWSLTMSDQYRAGAFKEGILLINSTHGYKWYEELWTRYTVCLARERIRFVKPDGTIGGQAKRGQTFVYFGVDDQKFAHVFGKLGRIIRP